MSDGKAVFSLEGDASSLKKAGDEAVSTVKKVADETVKANAKAQASGGGVGATPQAAGGATGTDNPVAAWAATVTETGKAREAVAKVGAETANAARAAGAMGGAFSKATSTVSALAGTAGFGPIPGIIARVTSMLGPMGLAISATVGAVALLVQKWLEAREATRQANEEIIKIRASFQDFARELLTPLSDFEKQLKGVGDRTKADTDALFVQFRKSSSSALQDAAAAYEKYWNERNATESAGAKLERDLVNKSEADKTQARIAAQDQEAAQRAEWGKNQQKIQLDLEKETIAKEREAKLAGMDDLQRAQFEADEKIAKAKDDLLGLENTKQGELLQRQLDAVKIIGDAQIAKAKEAAQARLDAEKKADDELQQRRLRLEEELQQKRLDNARELNGLAQDSLGDLEFRDFRTREW